MRYYTAGDGLSSGALLLRYGYVPGSRAGGTAFDASALTARLPSEADGGVCSFKAYALRVKEVGAVAFGASGAVGAVELRATLRRGELLPSLLRLRRVAALRRADYAAYDPWLHESLGLAHEWRALGGYAEAVRLQRLKTLAVNTAVYAIANLTGTSTTAPPPPPPPPPPPAKAAVEAIEAAAWTHAGSFLQTRAGNDEWFTFATETAHAAMAAATAAVPPSAAETPEALRQLGGGGTRFAAARAKRDGPQLPPEPFSLGMAQRAAATAPAPPPPPPKAQSSRASSSSPPPPLTPVTDWFGRFSPPPPPPASADASSSPLAEAGAAGLSEEDLREVAATAARQLAAARLLAASGAQRYAIGREAGVSGDCACPSEARNAAAAREVVAAELGVLDEQLLLVRALRAWLVVLAARDTRPGAAWGEQGEEEAPEPPQPPQQQQQQQQQQQASGGGGGAGVRGGEARVAWRRTSTSLEYVRDALVPLFGDAAWAGGEDESVGECGPRRRRGGVAGCAACSRIPLANRTVTPLGARRPARVPPPQTTGASPDAPKSASSTASCDFWCEFNGNSWSTKCRWTDTCGGCKACVAVEPKGGQ